MMDGIVQVGFLEVLRVYICGGRQAFFLVGKPDGSTHRVTGFQLIRSTWFGWGLVNAEIGGGGTINVDENIPREEIWEQG